MSNTWQRGKPGKQAAPTGTHSPSIRLPNPHGILWLKIFKAVTDIILIGWCIPPTCISTKKKKKKTYTNAAEACTHGRTNCSPVCLQWLCVSIYHSQYTWLLNLMDFSLQVTWEWYVNTDEKPKLAICIEILSPHRPSTSITINHEITMWHVNKAKGISNIDFCLESQSVTIS